MRVILWIFSVIFTSVLIVILSVVGGIWLLSSKIQSASLSPGAAEKQVSDSTVLTLDLERPVTEAAPQGFEQFFGEQKLPFLTMLGTLDRAAADARVKGLVVRTGSAQLGLAEAQELRETIKQFRAKGKFAFAYADTFGELAGGTRSYYVASAFDEIWLQPTGSLAVTGIAWQIPFFKGTLDKLGITPQFERRGEFKSAATQFTDTKLPDTDRVAMDDLVHGIYDQLAAGIAEGRKLEIADAKAMLDGGPYTGDEALAKHFVDHVGYLDEAEDAAKQRAVGGALVPLQSYLAQSRQAKLPGSSADAVALIRASGDIVGGRDNDNGFGESSNVVADTMARAFDEAIKDESVKVIVLRIESPGGSEVASETIWRAVARARKAGKPVIVSMADVAASGGYYIAAGADKIVADPLTITGSIGVFAGKMVTAGLWDKLGISWDTVSAGKNSDFESSLTPFSPEQRQRFAAMIDVSYKSFLTRVADGRHMDTTAVDKIARGRVWTGVEAKERGLVDELGGFGTAVKLAKQAAHLPSDQTVEVKSFPSRRTPWETLVNGFRDGDGIGEVATTLRRLAALAPLLRQIELAAEPASGDVMMRPIELKD